MNLSEVCQGVNKRKKKKRVGRGVGSGHGKTSSRGHKGQWASAGSGKPGALFVGGQTPLHRRAPKRGFSNNRFARQFAEINVGDLNGFDDGAAVDLDALKAKGIINGTWDGLRVLGNGELTKKLAVKADHFTASAKQKIEAKAGSTELIPPPNKPVRNKMAPPAEKKQKQ